MIEYTVGPSSRTFTGDQFPSFSETECAASVIDGESYTGVTVAGSYGHRGSEPAVDVGELHLSTH